MKPSKRPQRSSNGLKSQKHKNPAKTKNGKSQEHKKRNQFSTFDFLDASALKAR